MHQSHLSSSLSTWTLGLEPQRHSHWRLRRFPARRRCQDPWWWRRTCCCTRCHNKPQCHHCRCQSSVISRQCQPMQQPHLPSGLSSRSHQFERWCHSHIRCKPRQPSRRRSQPVRWRQRSHNCHSLCRHRFSNRCRCHHIRFNHSHVGGRSAFTNWTMGPNYILDVHCSRWLVLI